MNLLESPFQFSSSVEKKTEFDGEFISISEKMYAHLEVRFSFLPKAKKAIGRTDTKERIVESLSVSEIP